MVNRSWWRGRAATLSWLVALVAGLLVAAAYPAVARPPADRRPRPSAVAPHYKVAGKADPAAPPTFSCQVSTPGQLLRPGPDPGRVRRGQARRHGAGRTIVIVDAFQSPTIQHDLDLFDQVFELPAATVQIVAPDGLTPFDQNNANQVGWAGEITLDVEWAHAIAPAATIKLVLAKSNDDADILSATQFAVDHNLGDVISQSFGEAEQCVDPAIESAQHRMFAKATLKGITLLASSGDQGAAQPSCDGSTFIKAASSPATDPFVTAVGGTLLDADGLTGAYHSETTWNEPRVRGGHRRRLQHRLRHAGLPEAAAPAPRAACRTSRTTPASSPACSWSWSSSGLGPDLVFRFGGTSAGSPQWAGLIALAAQLRHARVGYLNPQVYALSLVKPVYTALFHDITTGDNTFHGEAITATRRSSGFPAATRLGPGDGPRHAEGEHAGSGARRQAAVTVGSTSPQDTRAARGPVPAPPLSPEPLSRLGSRVEMNPAGSKGPGRRTGVEAATPARGGRHAPAGSRRLQAGPHAPLPCAPAARDRGWRPRSSPPSSPPARSPAGRAGPRSAAPAPPRPPPRPRPATRTFGPNVLVFDPSMPQAQIQAAVDAVAARQISDQFGTGRFALLFKPGTYGSAAQPLRFGVGYYTEVAGLGRNPTERDQRLDRRREPVLPDPAGRADRLHRAGELLALDVEPVDQRHRARPAARPATSSGRCPRPRRCAGCRSTAACR